MKKEDAVKIVRDKRILACIALLLVLIIAALCAGGAEAECRTPGWRGWPP